MPTPPAGRLVGAPTWVDRLLLLVIPTAAAALLLGVLAAVFFSKPAPAAAASLAGTPCPAPTEHEQLLVVIGWHQGRLAAECIYVGSRGSYSRRTVRQVAR